MNYSIQDGWDDSPYRRKRKKTKIKKANHKHEYETLVVIDYDRYSFDRNKENILCVVGEYCPICGKFNAHSYYDWLSCEGKVCDIANYLADYYDLKTTVLFGDVIIPEIYQLTKEQVADMISDIEKCCIVDNYSRNMKFVNLDTIMDVKMNR